ncbi:MAG: hypothetical protein JXB45_05815 [Candidatus Krumholzibacteriota bacterium]|nr:hypothetical protein [Candidatus Krumholzibacteriota bacterium]
MKKMTVIILLGALVVAVICPGYSSAQKKNENINKSGVGVKNIGPLSVFKQIEKAWRGSNAGAIASLTGKGRIYLDIQGVGDRGGYFSKSQVYFMLQRLFKNEKQMRFEFVKYHNLENPGQKVYGIAYRSYKNIRSNRVFQDKVYITLRQEGSTWAVVEITTTR